MRVVSLTVVLVGALVGSACGGGPHLRAAASSAPKPKPSVPSFRGGTPPEPVTSVSINTENLHPATTSPVPGATSISAPHPGNIATTTTIAEIPGSRSKDGCVAQLVPAGATISGTVSGDVNGDGKRDMIDSYFKGLVGLMHLHVTLGGGGGFDTPVPLVGTSDSGAKVLGAVALSGESIPTDRSEQVFAVVGQGPNRLLNTEVFVYAACRLVPVQFANRAPAVFAIGGTASDRRGVQCAAVAGGMILARESARSTDGVQYQTTFDGYRYLNGTLQPYGVRLRGSLVMPKNANEIRKLSTLDCADIHL